ncbi:oxidoreductase [Penicillium taxi]|uniref:oxidoreductase n=1 Tax=Penicillium taxi TaxID=168475 RepID=UPI002544E4E4|nr:oxidoreductase [Penicillium taxi]KAJ5909274.1 oxidoreductase [Penicillium taxi]
MTVEEEIASLAIIDYEALANKDGKEIQKLVQACKSVGMFHLNLGNSRIKDVYEDIPNLIQAGNDFFNLPIDCEEKKQSIHNGMERGYHAAKTFEYYEIARDAYVRGEWTLPASLVSHEKRITRTLQSLHGAIQTILTELCTAVNVDIPELSDDKSVPSDTALKLVYKPPVQEAGAVVQPWHTDFGLMTLMWYNEVSAQIPIYDADGRKTERWQAVPVVEGAVLVNIADELEAKSGGQLRSTLHRAVTPPGPKKLRNGMVYLLRPYKI